MENARNQDSQVDPATAVFSRLESEVGEVHKLVAANDQSATLGQISVSLEKMQKAVEGITRHPALGLSPEAMSSRIVAAGETARKADSADCTSKRSDRPGRAKHGGAGRHGGDNPGAAAAASLGLRRERGRRDVALVHSAGRRLAERTRKLASSGAHGGAGNESAIPLAGGYAIDEGRQSAGVGCVGRCRYDLAGRP